MAGTQLEMVLDVVQAVVLEGGYADPFGVWMWTVSVVQAADLCY